MKKKFGPKKCESPRCENVGEYAVFWTKDQQRGYRFCEECLEKEKGRMDKPYAVFPLRSLFF